MQTYLTKWGDRMANLHLVTGYAGAAHVSSADQGSFNVGILGTGSYVLDRGNKFAISVISNNQVRILDGDILMQGRHIRLNTDTYVDLTIENGEQGMLRNDLIVCRYTKDSGTGVEQANLVVIKGTSAASDPADPAYTSGDIVGDSVLVADFPLYRIQLDGLNVQTPVALFGDTLPTLKSHMDNSDIHTTVNYYTVAVTASWTADSTNGGYYQAISVDGILDTDNPVYDVVLGTDTAANTLYLDAFALVTRLTTGNGSITLWANDEAPTNAFTLLLQVVR